MRLIGNNNDFSYNQMRSINLIILQIIKTFISDKNKYYNDFVRLIRIYYYFYINEIKWYFLLK